MTPPLCPRQQSVPASKVTPSICQHKSRRNFGGRHCIPSVVHALQPGPVQSPWSRAEPGPVQSPWSRAKPPVPCTVSPLCSARVLAAALVRSPDCRTSHGSRRK
uniref:Uncharacterized protein n=1 Tax=Knipowitschia caucasica TaxID=637954 RepID=A0AAV2MB64_KNICA